MYERGPECTGVVMLSPADALRVWSMRYRCGVPAGGEMTATDEGTAEPGVRVLVGVSGDVWTDDP